MASWLREKGSTIGAIAGTLAAIVAVLQLFVVGPMNQRFNDLRAYMDQQFDAQDQRIDGLTAYMTQRFEAVDQRFDAQDEQRDRLEAETSRRFDAMDARFDSQQAQTNRRFDAVLEAIMGFDRRVSRNEGQIEVIREQIQAVDAP